MPEVNAIITSNGLQLSNVVTLGSATDTGASSTFAINPLENYLIAAEQFVIDPDYDEPLISSVTFSNSSTAFGIDNTVLCTIVWVETTITSTVDIDLPIIFSGDTDVVPYDSLFTSLSFTYLPIFNMLPNNQNVSVTPADGFTIDAVASNIVISENTDGTTSYDISCDVSGNEPVEVAQVTFTTIHDGNSGEGRYYYAKTLADVQDQLNESFDTSGEAGSFSIELENDASDNYGNVHVFTFIIIYQRADGVSIDAGASVTTSTNLFEYKALFTGSYNLPPAGADEHQVAFTTSSALVAHGFTLSESVDWITNGSTSTSYSSTGGVFYVDVADNGTNPTRIATLSLISDPYPLIVRDTTTLQQNELNFLTLEVANLNSDGSYTIIPNNSEANPAKIISSPGSMIFQDGYNVINGSYFNADQGENNYNFDDGSGGQTNEYALILTTNPTFTFDEVTIDTFNLQTTQELYPLTAEGGPIFPGSRWCVIDDFPTTFTPLGDGIYLKKFRVRNQDIYNNLGATIVNNPLQNKDRTASFTVTHPISGSTATVFIEQDKKYTKDTTLAQHEDIQAKAAYMDISTGTGAVFPSYSTAPTLDVTTGFNSELSVYTIKLKFLDFETDFDLKNLITTDSTSHTLNQYPLPQYTYDAGNVVNWEGAIGVEGFPEIIPNDHSFFSDYLEGSTLTYNANFNEASTDTDYHYKFSFKAENNNSWSDRIMNFYFNHPENFNAPSTDSSIYDIKVTIKQTLTNLLDAFALDDSGSALPMLDPNFVGISSFYDLDYTAGSQEIGVIFNTSDGTFSSPNPVTIGLWDVLNSNYTPLASNIEQDGFSYETIDNTDFIITNTNGTHYFTFTLSVTENPSLTDKRKIVLGFWHPTLDPAVNAPNATLAFRQDTQPFNENTMGVELYTNDDLNLNADGGTATVMINVLDYTADNFSNDTNVPEAEAWLWAGPFPGDGPYNFPNYDSLGYISSTPQLTVIKNESYATPGSLTIDGVTTNDGTGNTYTHYVQVPYNSYTSFELKHIAVRAKHSFAGAVQDDNDYIFFKLQNVLSNLFISEFKFGEENLIGYNLLGNFPFVNMPPLSNPGQLKIKITGQNFPADWFGGGDPQIIPSQNQDLIYAYPASCISYKNLQTYIHARFIDSNYVDLLTGTIDNTNAKVFRSINPSLENPLVYLPAGLAFTSSGGSYNTNSEYIIEDTDNPASQGSSSTNLQDQYFDNNYTSVSADVIISDSQAVDPVYLGTQSFVVTLDIKNHGLNESEESIIGLWTGQSMPKSNHIGFTPMEGTSFSQYSSVVSQENPDNFVWVRHSQNGPFGIVTTGENDEVFYYLTQTLNLEGQFAKREWTKNLVELDPENKGFSYNYHPINNLFSFTSAISGETYNNTSDSYINIGFKIINPAGEGDISSEALGDEFIIEFEVYDYETNDHTQQGFGLFTSGSWYTAPDYATSSSNFMNKKFVTDEYSNNIIQITNDASAKMVATEATRIRGNGKYNTRIKINYINRHIKFFARQCVRFKIKNLIVSSPIKERMLDPDNNITFNTTPDYYLYFKQQPLVTNAFKFASSSPYVGNYAHLNGSPFGTFAEILSINTNAGFDAILIGLQDDDFYNNAIPSDSLVYAGQSTIPNQDVAYIHHQGTPTIMMHLQNATSPLNGAAQILAWDGNSNSPLIDNPMVTNLGFGISVPNAYISISFGPNPSSTIRFMRIGIYASTPATSTEVPDDIYTIVQQANPNV